MQIGLAGWQECAIFALRNDNERNDMKTITGIGNALTDALVRVDDDKVLDALGLPKGSMQLIDDDRLPAIRQAMEALSVSRSTGGSAGNTTKALAHLGVRPGFIGKVGRDATGSAFAQSATAIGIEPRLALSDKPSGVAHTFISTDGERTFGTYLGAAADLTADDLDADMFAGYDYLYIEGYLVQNHPMILRAIELARQQGLKICLDLASYNIVQDDHAFFEQMLADAVDVVFANEEEARAFSGCEPAEALERLATLCEVAVVKLGKHGSSIMRGQEKVVVPSLPVERVLDTTGAGDFYAAGVMYGLLQDWDIMRCAQAGSVLAAHVIQTIGTTLPESEWNEIRQQVNAL